MTSNETVNLRRATARLAEIAERLYGETIGLDPITKKEASTQIYDVLGQIRLLTDRQNY